MGSYVAAEAAADEVHALQGQGIEEALKGAAEGVKRVKGGGLRRNDVVSFGAQRTQLPEEVGAGAAGGAQEHDRHPAFGAAAVIPPLLQHVVQHRHQQHNTHHHCSAAATVASAPVRTHPPTRRTSLPRKLP